MYLFCRRKPEEIRLGAMRRTCEHYHKLRVEDGKPMDCHGYGGSLIEVVKMNIEWCKFCQLADKDMAFLTDRDAAIARVVEYLETNDIREYRIDSL